ncbi:MAG TPA: NrsF family protein [Polyangia bacterium]|nr:NrsF family protein [Polyangia bacterium]
MTTKDFDDGALPPGRIDAPPPSLDLLNAVEGMKPVRTRARFGTLAVVALIGLSWPALVLTHHAFRPDLAALPLGWVIASAALWSAAFAVSLTAALVPRRGDVLPAPGRASRVGGTAVTGLFLFALVASVQVPGISLRPEDAHMTLLQSCVHCASFVLEVAAPFLLAGLFALHRLVPMGRARIGMALGAAGGAVGGLVLHFICPFAGTAHVVLGHVGGTILAAAAGAALLPALLRRG